MDQIKLADLRREYSLKDLSKSSVAADPIVQFGKWMNEALDSNVIEPAAMTLSTADGMGRPSSRVVLLKGFDADGFVFFTNYESKKASDLKANPHASLHFFWPDLERQVIIRGTVVKVSVDESRSYFSSRPRESQIGAWASRQSSILNDREELEQKVREIKQRFGSGEIPYPQFWGGFRVVPILLEFWQGRESRLHDRIAYERVDETWKVFRLSP